MSNAAPQTNPRITTKYRVTRFARCYAAGTSRVVLVKTYGDWSTEELAQRKALDVLDCHMGAIMRVEPVQVYA